MPTGTGIPITGHDLDRCDPERYIHLLGSVAQGRIDPGHGRRLQCRFLSASRRRPGGSMDSGRSCVESRMARTVHLSIAFRWRRDTGRGSSSIPLRPAHLVGGARREVEVRTSVASKVWFFSAATRLHSTGRIFQRHVGRELNGHSRRGGGHPALTKVRRGVALLPAQPRNPAIGRCDPVFFMRTGTSCRSHWS